MSFLFYLFISFFTSCFLSPFCVPYMNVAHVHIKCLLYSRCSFSHLELHLSYDWSVVALNMSWSFSNTPICACFKPSVYQACNMQIRGVQQDVGVIHAWVCQEMWAMTGKLWPWRFIIHVNSLWNTILYSNLSQNYGHPEVYQAYNRQIKSGKGRK